MSKDLMTLSNYCYNISVKMKKVIYIKEDSPFFRTMIFHYSTNFFVEFCFCHDITLTKSISIRAACKSGKNGLVKVNKGGNGDEGAGTVKWWHITMVGKAFLTLTLQCGEIFALCLRALHLI